MKKETILLIVVCLVVGVLGGIIYTNAKRDKSSGSGVASTAPVDYQQKIQTLTNIVAQDPNNRNAWVELGNKYFDSNQSMKAIEAYGKALELNGNDANVLTDLGVMHRRVGWYEKAIESFKKANSIDPNHATSLFNMGIVYLYDLNDKEKARDAWNRFLKISPSGQGADNVRRMLSEM